VEDILRNYTKHQKGSLIVDKLKRGEYYTRDERVNMIKVLGKYLMKNCETLVLLHCSFIVGSLAFAVAVT
jgi:hypothetical protein